VVLMRKKAAVEGIIEEAIHKLKNFPVAILTGATKFGIPEYATLAAKKNGMKIIGILPSVGKKHAFAIR
jgi:hypothetical protein